jgi:signal transduction histidine kinase
VPRILLLLEHEANRRLLAERLAERYEVLSPAAEPALDLPFDLCIVDGPASSRLLGPVRARKEAERPAFLPVLLLTSREEVRLVTRRLGGSVDELIIEPIERRELYARVESLLRLRRLSVELADALAAQRAATEEVERVNRAKSEFISTASHEIRSALAGIQGMGELIRDEDLASEESKEYAGDIVTAAQRLNRMITDLVDLDRMESGR